MTKDGSISMTTTVGCPGILAGSVPDAALVYTVVANLGARCPCV